MKQVCKFVRQAATAARWVPAGKHAEPTAPRSHVQDSMGTGPSASVRYSALAPEDVTHASLTFGRHHCTSWLPGCQNK